MKKIAFFVVAVCCWSFVFAQKNSNSGSQNHENRPLYFGVSVGPTVDWFIPMTKDFKLVREKPKAGFFAGINIDVNLTKGRWLYFSTGLVMRYLQGELAFENQYVFSKFIMITDTLVLPTVRTFQTNYLVIPTGIKFRTPPSRGCIFVGKLGLYHQFKLGGDKFDTFSFFEDLNYFITTPNVKNDDAALFTETGYVGLGFEYVFKSNIRVFMNADYSCQFNYFSSKAISNVVPDARFRAIVHSLHITFGILF